MTTIVTGIIKTTRMTRETGRMIRERTRRIVRTGKTITIATDKFVCLFVNAVQKPGTQLLAIRSSDLMRAIG